MKREIACRTRHYLEAMRQPDKTYASFMHAHAYDAAIL
jgi:hypothetical protein